MKKFFTACICLTMIASIAMCAPVSAACSTTCVDDIALLRYEQIGNIVADIRFEDNFVYAIGSYRVRLTNPQVVMKITLQESSNGSSWQDKFSRTRTFTETASKEQDMYLPIKNKFYRVKVTVDVYYSNGTYIESAEVYSAIKLYN